MNNRTQGNSKIRYLERDISWMYFNHRLLKEASKPSVPLLERLKFIGIYSNNLDEFFRVRVASLNRIAECVNEVRNDEILRVDHTLRKIDSLYKQFSKEHTALFGEIKERLSENGILILDEHSISDSQRGYVLNFARSSNLIEALNPLMLSQQPKSSSLTDNGVHLAVLLFKRVLDQDIVKECAVIELPVGEYDRFVRLPDTDGKSCYIMLDDVVRLILPEVFIGGKFDKFEAYTFKFTKDAEMEIDMNIQAGFMEKISKAVRNRKKGETIRVVIDREIPRKLEQKVLQFLSIDRSYTRMKGGKYHNFKDFINFPVNGRTDLTYQPQPPVLRYQTDSHNGLIRRIIDKDLIIHTPYNSFANYLDLLREASIDKNVKSIKTTIYRLSKNSKVVQALINAARNGKKVTVVMELLARFDEDSNITWSKKMQEEGITVIFGVEGLKIHSKLTYIKRKDVEIACISTGNFHEGNAKLYTDLTLMTANRAISREVNAVFKYIERPYENVRFNTLLVSPNNMRRRLVAMINREIKNARNGKPSYIKCKLNHVTDKKIIKKLYEASCAGVDIRLLVRGNCSVVAGVKDMSENIMIRAIIDRYLEHSRFFIFANGGDESIYLGSADWMLRNLTHRIETYTPVYDADIRDELRMVFDMGFSDTVQGFSIDGTGDNESLSKELSDELSGSQSRLYKYYSE